MNEEEKEAFKVLKDLLLEFEDVETWVIVNFSKKEFESLRICVNLIKKQQKELYKIKALNIPIDTLVAEFERLENIEDDRDCNYISKDKIREKIEDVSNGVYDAKLILKDLLEEE